MVGGRLAFPVQAVRIFRGGAYYAELARHAFSQFAVHRAMARLSPATHWNDAASGSRFAIGRPSIHQLAPFLYRIAATVSTQSQKAPLACAVGHVR